jgi:hypothetical protein
MEIPITGLIIHSDDSDSSHSHQLYITSWDGKPVHVHPFSGSTTFNNGHDHYFAGTTEPAATGVEHVHGYHVVTSINDGHTHLIRGATGTSIEIETGGHFHRFEGFTTVNGRNPHSHMYEGATENEVFDL